MGIMFADVNDVFFGHDLRGVDGGVNQVGRWMNNLPFPKKLLMFFFGPSTSIDWTRIDRFFLVVKRPGPGAGGGSGQLTLATVRPRRRPGAAPERVFHAGGSGERRPARDRISPEPAGEHRALRVVERGGGRDPPPRAWLYDQPPAPLALTREGRCAAAARQRGHPVGSEARRVRVEGAEARRPLGARLEPPDRRRTGGRPMGRGPGVDGHRSGAVRVARRLRERRRGGGARGPLLGDGRDPADGGCGARPGLSAPRRHRMGCGSALLVVRLRGRASRWTWPRGCRPSPAIRWSTAPGEAWTRSGSCAGPW